MANSSNKQHPWFEIFHSRPTAKYQVFIFPAAGSPGSFYRQWDKDFPEYEFSLVTYPGRLSRMKDELITNLKDYINQLDQGLLPYISKPCFFIGHSIIDLIQSSSLLRSLGCLISFALAKHMIETKTKGNLLRLMIQMGGGPLHLDDPAKSLADMTDAEIREDLKRIADPATKYIYDVPSYVDMLIPMLRADGQVGKEILEKTPLDIPIIIYGGEKDENLGEEFLHRWEELTTMKNLFRVRMFPGHHNFQAECSSQVLACLKEDFNCVINTLCMN